MDEEPAIRLLKSTLACTLYNICWVLSDRFFFFRRRLSVYTILLKGENNSKKLKKKNPKTKYCLYWRKSFRKGRHLCHPLFLFLCVCVLQVFGCVPSFCFMFSGYLLLLPCGIISPFVPKRQYADEHGKERERKLNVYAQGFVSYWQHFFLFIPSAFVIFPLSFRLSHDVCFLPEK